MEINVNELLVVIGRQTVVIMKLEQQIQELTTEKNRNAMKVVSKPPELRETPEPSNEKAGS